MSCHNKKEPHAKKQYTKKNLYEVQSKLTINTDQT